MRKAGPSSRTPKGCQLAAVFLYFCAFGPVGLEFAVADLQVFQDVRILGNEIVAGTGFEEFLLDRQPGCLIDPDLAFVDLPPFCGRRGCPREPAIS